MVTQYASAPCKLTLSLHLFARWRCCSSIIISSYLFARWHLFRHVGYLRHLQQVDLLILKVVSESRVTWATSVPILVFLGLSVLKLGSMYATDRRQTERRQTKASLNASALWGGGITNNGINVFEKQKSVHNCKAENLTHHDGAVIPVHSLFSTLPSHYHCLMIYKRYNITTP